MSTFLSILKEYFEAKKEDEILIKDKHDIVIPIEWLFTEGIDRTVIERAMANLLKKSNSRYADNMKELGRNPDKIKDFAINIYNDRLELFVRGRDEFTKAIISEEPKKNSKIRSVSEEDFYVEILNALKKIDLEGTEEELSEEDRQSIQSLFGKINLSKTDKVTIEGIKQALNEAGRNLGKYYDYLTQEKRKTSNYHTTIYQNKDEVGKKGKRINSKPKRKSEIYPFVERAKILEDMKPECHVDVDEIDDEGNKMLSSYTVFVYRNPRKKDGYLFVAEPLEGAHSTRVKYMPQKEYDEFKEKEGEAKVEGIAKHYLEMSPIEFDKQKFARNVRHTEMETFKERLRYIILGEKNKNSKSQTNYTKIENQIYGKLQITSDDIKNMGETATISQVEEANKILDIRNRQEEATQTKKGE